MKCDYCEKPVSSLLWFSMHEDVQFSFCCESHQRWWEADQREEQLEFFPEAKNADRNL